jgi:parallel beta helix pectate lyase-like protein
VAPVLAIPVFSGGESWAFSTGPVAVKRRRLIGLVAPIAAVPMVLAATGSAHAAATTRYVATTGSDVGSDCTDPTHPCRGIQYAVDQANAGDTVSIGPGLYAESVRTRKSLTIVGAGVGGTKISGDGSRPSVTVDGYENDIVPVVTVRSLDASDNADSSGFAATAAILTIADAAARQNRDYGVVGMDSTVHVVDSTLAANGRAGAQLASGALTITRSAVTANEGGGVVDESGTAQVRDSTVSGNVGAGVVADGAGTNVTVAGSTIAHTAPFTDRTPAYGGGVLVLPSGTATVSESTLYGNAHFGMAVSDGVGHISNSTISATAKGLSDQFQGGLVYASTGASSSNGLTAVGTLDAGNAVPDCAGTIADHGYNLDGDGSCHLSATGSRKHANADLGKLASNGGPTETVLPGFGSAARNAIPGGSAGCVTGAADQRGRPRRSPAGGRCDIGSVEATVVNPTLHAHVTGTHRAHGWFRGRVTVSYTCQRSTAPLTRSCPSATVFRSSGRAHHVTKTIAAVDGGRASVTVRGIHLDNTKPRVEIDGVQNGRTYPRVQNIHRSCHDTFSGVASCRLRTHQHGSTVDYKVKARDKAGNVRVKSGRYFIST